MSSDGAAKTTALGHEGMKEAAKVLDDVAFVKTACDPAFEADVPF
jgi:hypothetical protein